MAAATCATLFGTALGLVKEWCATSGPLSRYARASAVDDFEHLARTLGAV